MKRIIMIIVAAVLLSIGMVGWFAVSDPARLIAGTIPKIVGIDSRLVFFGACVIAGGLIGHLIATTAKGHHC